MEDVFLSTQTPTKADHIDISKKKDKVMEQDLLIHTWVLHLSNHFLHQTIDLNIIGFTLD